MEIHGNCFTGQWTGQTKFDITVGRSRRYSHTDIKGVHGKLSIVCTFDGWPRKTEKRYIDHLNNLASGEFTITFS